MNNAYECAYCGSNKQITRDHIIPRSYSGTSSWRESELNPMVNCCHHCNSLLGNRAPHDFEGRANFLFKKLNDKYKNILRVPDWSENDYKGMNPKFAKKIREKEAFKKSIKDRLNHLDTIRFG